MPPIYISTTNLTTSDSLLDTLNIYHTAGIKAVELGSGHPPFPRYQEILVSYPFEYTVHNFFPLTDPDHLINIASQNPEHLNKTKDIARNAIGLCNQIGSRFYGIHAGYRADLDTRSLGNRLTANQIKFSESAFTTMVETTQDLCDYAADKNVTVVVENHVLAPFNLVENQNLYLLLCSAEEIVEFSRAVARVNFGMLIDVAHLKVTANTLEFDKYQFIESVSPWIKLFHLSENTAQSDLALPFGKGAWFEPVIKQRPEIPCVIETHVAEITPLLRQQELVSRWQSG